MKPKKRGRPALPARDVKKVFPLRLSDNELAKLEKAAALRGLTVRELMMVGLNALIDEASEKQKHPSRHHTTPPLNLSGPLRR